MARLKRAGAIVIGKTNLDQFATGLVGVRSPYGVPRNAFDPALIPGGSSSGSAVAVAAGLVPLALGTDTAGSGRVPAGLNNIVGLKPSLGLVSTAGVVPACRSLDCVSIFALTTDDAWTALAAIAGPDAADPYSRDAPARRTRHRRPAACGSACRSRASASSSATGRPQRPTTRRSRASPRSAPDRRDRHRAVLRDRAAALRRAVGGRALSSRSRKLLASSPDAIHPVTREIIAAGTRPSAVDAFAAFYQLEELRRVRDVTFRQIDALLLPTAPTVYTVEQVLADPIQLNSRLGTYTNFVNLLDLCGLAVPAVDPQPTARRSASRCSRPAGHDALAGLDRPRVPRRHRAAARRARPAAAAARGHCARSAGADEIAIAVVGAHLSGMPLNGELKALGARLLETTRDRARLPALCALRQRAAASPGLLRVGTGKGSAIEVEIWALRAEGFGRFVAAVPPPLSIGTLRLADGRTVKGFLVEAEAVTGARDISSFGGWRAYPAQAKVPAA